MNEFQAQLDRAFPEKTDLPLLQAVSDGVVLADASMATSRLLSGQFGLDLRGHIRRAGIQTSIHEACQAGRLPFHSSLERMPTGGWHWIELTSASVIAHVHRTEGPVNFPVDTPTRQDERYSNQGDFFASPDVGREISFRCAWLMFGLRETGELNHLCWGMPAAERDVWLARTNVLRRLEQADRAQTREEPSAKLVLKFRESIEAAFLTAKDGHG